jgi:CHAT domain/SIR2-like domain
VKNAVEIQIGLSWSAEQTAFDVTLHASTSDEILFIKLPHEPFRLDLPTLQALVPEIDAYATSLSDQLFVIPELRDKFVEMATVAEERDSPLHVRLMLDRLAPADYHTARWELLRDPRDNSPIALKNSMTFTRFVNPRTHRTISLRTKGDLRALIVAADPDPAELGKYGATGNPLQPINAREEAARAQQCLQPIATTVLCERGKATLDGVTTALKEADAKGQGYDIVYLLAHGALHQQGPVLYLESESGGVAPIAGAKFAEAMTALDRPPALVVLSSCETAASADDHHVTSMGEAAVALGPMLSGDGISAVIGMHGRATVETVETFMPRFFTTLQQTGSIYKAMLDARMAVRDRWDWWAPVLLTRMRSGVIWYSPGYLNPGRAPRMSTFVGAMKNNACTPIIGPRLSTAFFPDRQSTARGIATRLQVPITPGSSNDLARVSQYLAVAHDARYPRTVLVEYLTERIVEDGGLTDDDIREADNRVQGQMSAGPRLSQLISQIGKRHRAQDPDDPYAILAAMRFPIYFTTSFTSMLEDALADAERKPKVVDVPWEGGRVRGRTDSELDLNHPTVVRLFGGFDNPDSMVLTEDDYFKYLTTWTTVRGAALRGLQSHLTNNNMLLMGFGLDDWDFRVLFRSIFTMGGAAPRLNSLSHIAVQVTPESDSIEADAVQDYLEQYYSKAANFSVRWGTPSELLTELRNAWSS